MHIEALWDLTGTIGKKYWLSHLSSHQPNVWWLRLKHPVQGVVIELVRLEWPWSLDLWVYSHSWWMVYTAWSIGDSYPERGYLSINHRNWMQCRCIHTHTYIYICIYRVYIVLIHAYMIIYDYSARRQWSWRILGKTVVGVAGPRQILPYAFSSLDLVALATALTVGCRTEGNHKGPAWIQSLRFSVFVSWVDDGRWLEIPARQIGRSWNHCGLFRPIKTPANRCDCVFFPSGRQTEEAFFNPWHFHAISISIHCGV